MPSSPCARSMWAFSIQTNYSIVFFKKNEYSIHVSGEKRPPKTELSRCEFFEISKKLWMPDNLWFIRIAMTIRLSDCRHYIFYQQSQWWTNTTFNILPSLYRNDMTRSSIKRVSFVWHQIEQSKKITKAVEVSILTKIMVLHLLQERRVKRKPLFISPYFEKIKSYFVSNSRIST